jgi:hypothetical protein
MTTPSEQSIRKACEEIGVEYIHYLRTTDRGLSRLAILALARRIEAEAVPVEQERAYPIGTRVRKVSGPEWDGVVVGYYSSTFTPEGLVIECTAPGAKGQVHVEPSKRIERHEDKEPRA